jgi:hypothetical protein
MFDFEKLTVYQKTKAFHKEIAVWLKSNPKIDFITRDQLRRAALSIPLNIALGRANERGLGILEVGGAVLFVRWLSVRRPSVLGMANERGLGILEVGEAGLWSLSLERRRSVG